MTSSSPSILLLGCGYTLSRVAQLLGSDAVVCATRRAASTQALRAQGFCCEEVSIESIEQLAKLFIRYPTITTIIDGVPPFFTAASPDAPLDEGTSGPRSLLNAIDTRPIRVVYLSTTGVYGERDGAIVTEASPLHPREGNAAARAASERVYQTSSKHHSTLRIAAIYGPERNPLDRLTNGTYRTVSGADRWTNRIHVADLAAAIASIATGNDVAPILNASDGDWLRSSEVIALCRQYAQFPPPPAIAPEHAHHTMLSNQRVDSSLLRSTVLREMLVPSLTSFLETLGR